MIPEKPTPFNEDLVIDLMDANGDPVAIADVDDVKVLLLVNERVKLKYKKVADAGTGWLAWAGGEGSEPTSVKCPVTEEQSNGWRGLITADVELVYSDSYFIFRLPLYTAFKSGYTTEAAAEASPVSFTTAFSCDEAQQLAFSCTITAPAGNYVIQIKIAGEWQRLYNGYIEKDAADAIYTETVSLTEQIAAGNYYIRVTDALTGASSKEQLTYLPDCTKGA